MGEKRRNSGRSGLGIGLTMLLGLSATGFPTEARAVEDPAAEALRELQADLDALFAPDSALTSAPAPARGDADGEYPWWPGLVPGQFAVSQLAAPQLTMPLLAAGPAEASVAVTSIGFVEANVNVTLEWDDVLGIAAFEVLRDGAVVAEVSTSEFTDTVSADATYEYEVRAIEPGIDPVVGITSVAVPAVARGCDFSWTGAIDSAFADESNWAPIGGTPAVPEDGDHVCIDLRQNTPVRSIGVGAGVGTATTTLEANKDLPRLLEIAGGDFTVSAEFDDVDLLISGGSFTSTGTTNFRLLTVTDGELALTGNVAAPEGVQFGPGSPIVSAAEDSEVRFDVSPGGGGTIGAALTDATLTLDGPVRLGNPGDFLEMNGTSSIVPGAAGSTLATSTVSVGSGAAQVDVSMSSAITVNNGAELTVTNHQAFANNTFPPQLFLAGTLTLTQPITRLGNVDYRSAATQIFLNGGPANDFTGLDSINDMSFDEASNIVVRDDIQVRSLSMNNGATFTVDGELDYTSFLSLSGAAVTAPTIVTTGTGSSDGDIDVFGTANRIVGDITTDGTIFLNSDFEVGADAGLAIDGSLTLAADSIIQSTVTGSDVTGRLAVRDEVVLDGEVFVRVNGTIPADTDVAAVSWGSVTGSASLTLSGNTDDTTIEQKPGGIFVRRDGGGPGLDVTQVAALGLFVDVELGSQLQLGWPTLADTDRYRVLQDDTEIGEATGTTALADLSDAEPGDEIKFQVIAIGIEEGETNLGSLTIVIPSGDCTIAWTGAIDDAWSTPFNWMPISEEELPSPRVPGTLDDVCVDSTFNTPVVIDGDVSIETLSSEVAPGAADSLIDVRSGDVGVATSIGVPSLTVAGGSVTTASLVADSLVLGNVVVDATTSDIGAVIVQALGEEVQNAELLGAATIGRVTQAADTTLRIEDLQSPGDTVLDLAGSTALDKEVAELAELYLFEAGALSVGGGLDNVLTGLTQIDFLAVQDTLDVSLPENITVGDLSVSDTGLEGDGDVTISDRLALGDGSIVDIAGDLTLGAAATLAVTSTNSSEFTQVDIVGTANLDGALTVDIGEPVSALPFITWASSSGSFDSTSLTGAGAADAELIVGATGISIEPVSTGPPALSVLGLDVGDGLGDVDLVLSWPAFDGASSYQVRRNDAVVVASVAGLIADVSSEATATETWTVVALDDALRAIGLVGSLDVLAAVNGCEIAWTGAIGDSWDEPLNWAPVVSGGVVPTQTVPVFGDSACIHVDNNLPVQVVVDTVVSDVYSLLESRDRIGLADTTIAIEVAAANFTVVTGLDTSGVSVRSGGELELESASMLSGDLVIDDASIDLGTSLSVSGAVIATGSTSVFDVTAEGVSFEAGRANIDDSTVAFEPELTATLGDTVLSDGVLAGGPLVTVTELTAEDGGSFVAGAGITLGRVVVDDGARLVIDEIETLADTDLEVAGRLELIAPGAGLGSLDITSADAEVVVDGGEVNLLTGVKNVGSLAIFGNLVAFDGGLTARSIQLEESNLITGGAIEAAEVVSVGESSIEGGDVTLISDPEGIFDPRIVAGSTVFGTTLTIDGDLTLNGDTSLALLAHNSPTAPLLQVTGAVQLDGGVSVVLPVNVPAGTDQPIFTWSSSTGVIADELTGDGAGSADVVATPTGLVLRSIVPLPDQLVAFGIELGENDEDPSTVSLTWPALAGATSYVIERRDGAVIGTATDTVAAVNVPAEDRSELTVTGFDDDKPLGAVGTVSFFILPGCDITWTGAVGNAWGERLNWTPMVSNGVPLPSMRAPGVGDRACVGVETNLPAQVDDDVSIESLLAITERMGTVGFPVDTEVIAVDGADFTITDSVVLGSATLTDATLSVGGGAVLGNLTMRDAAFEFAALTLGIDGTVTATGSINRLVSTAPSGGELTIDEVVADETDLRLVGDIDSTIRRLELMDSTVRDGTGASITELDATIGSSVFAVGGLNAAEINVATGADLAIPITTRFDNSFMNVEGRLQLPVGFDVLGDLTLAATGAVAIGSGRDNDLTDIARIGSVEITGNSLAIGNPVDVSAVALLDASLEVSGTLNAEYVLGIGVSEITAPTTVIAADVLLQPVLASSNLEGDSQFTIRGDLTLPNDGQIILTTGGLPLAPLITITGAVALAGEARVLVQEIPDPESDIELIRWGSATGTLATTLIGDGLEAKDADVRQRDAGLFLVAGGVAECGPAPQFANMDVDGCWVNEGDGTFTASRIDNVDGVAIGGVEIGLLDDETTITIDNNDSTIRTSDAGGDPAAVAVSIPITDGTIEVARLRLGTISFDSFEIGTSLSFPLDDLFGLPVLGTPSLVSREGGWNLQLGFTLAGLLRTAGSFDLPVGQGGILSTDFSLDDLSAVFGDLAGIVNLDIDWRDASTWDFSSLGLGGPSITGDIDFDELDGGGTLSVRDLRVDDVLVVPDFDLTGVFTDTTRSWTVSQPSPSSLRSLGFAYTPAGELVSAEVLLGNAAGETSRTSVASWGEWLDIDAFELAWNADEKQWNIDGRLTSPDVAFTGLYRADADGDTEAFELNIMGAELGPFATFSLDLSFDGSGDDGDVYNVTAAITRDGAPPVNADGVFTFADGDLATASLTFESIVIGELLTVEEFSFTYNREEGQFTLGGVLVDPGGDDNAVSGSLTFDDGKLIAGQLRLDSLKIGPVQFDEFAFDFARTVGDERLTSATISGNVQVGTREARPVSGSIEFVDGDLTLLDLQVGTVDLGGIAQIDDLTFGYVKNDDGTATIGGEGQLVTSDGVTDTPVLVELTLRDGRVVDGRIEADVLSFGRAITIENFEMINSPVTPGICSPFPAPEGAQQWQITGQTTSAGETTSVEGCLVLDGARLAAGSIELGNLRIGGLLTIENLEASFSTSVDETVTGPDGEDLVISRTDMALSATAAVGDGEPKSFSGSASFANGGLTALALSLPDLDLMNVVKLRDVEFSYVSGTPWDRDIDTSFSLSGLVVGENTTSPFAGDITFGEDGEVEALTIDAENIDFGIFVLDVLSFSYTAAIGETEWALSGQVTVDGEPTSISGSATLEDGRVTSADLDIEQLVIGDLVVIDAVSLDYVRDSDGSEAWLGSASVVTPDGKSNEVTLGFAFDADGTLVFGSVTIARIKWSELLVFEDVGFTYETDDGITRWDVTGGVSLDGETTALSGFIQLEAGRATAGELVITNLRIGELTTIRTLTLAADTAGAVTTWAASIAFDNDANTTGSGSLTWTDGRLTAGQLDLTDIRFGPTFTLSEASLSLDSEAWTLSAQLDNAGDNNSISFVLGFDDGRLVSAEFQIAELKFGDVLTIDDFTISYGKTANGASWIGSATTTVGGRTTSVAASFDFENGRLITARIEIGQLRWSEAVVLDDVILTFDRSTNLTRWTLTGGIIIDGETTSLSGFLTLDDGRVIGGNLNIANLRVGPLATIEELSLDYVADDTGSRFTADIIFSNGSGAGGSMTWVDGRLDRATLGLDDIDLGPTFTLSAATMSYTAGTWAFEATFDNDGTGSTISGSLIFRDGRLVDGTLSASDIRIAGFSLSDFALVLGDRVNVGGGSEAIADICDVTDPGGPGEVYGIIAGFVNDSGSIGTVAGRLRSDDGRITDGVLCASDLSIAGMLVIDDFLLQPTTLVAGNEVQETWSGSIELSNPSSPDEPFTGDFDWVSRNGTTESVEIAVGELRFSDLLAFETVTFSYDKTPSGSTWAIGAALKRPGSNPSVSGSIDFTDGAFTGAGLTISNVSFGNAFSLRDFTMTYVGRRAESTLPDQDFDDDGVFPPLPIGNCNATPSGSNVPSGPPSTTGAEAYFRIGATVGAGDSAFGAAGSIGLVDGRMSMFDVSISCMNFGEWLTLEDIRIGRSADGDYLFQAGEVGSSGPGLRAAGRINIGENGRVSGGRLQVRDLSIGLLELDSIRLTLGEQDDGTSEWGAAVVITDQQGLATFTADGSVQIDDGKVIGGTLELPDLPLLGLLPVRNVSLGLERLGNGELHLSGGLTLVGPNDSDAGDIDVRAVWLDGDLVAGSILANATKLFGVIDSAGLEILYDADAPGGPRWSGSFQAQSTGTGSSSTAILASIDVINGRLDSGIIGFDGDGDGVVDAPDSAGRLPASGNGALGNFPLKGLYLRYCAADSPATFCNGVIGAEWDGRLKIELPTSGAPGLDAAFTVRDGRFVRASIDLTLDPGIMIFAGVFLDSIGGALELDPRLRLCGRLGASIGSPSLPIGRIEGSFQFSEQYSDLGFLLLRPDPPVGCSEPPTPGLFPLPADLEPDSYRFLLQAEMDLFPNNPLGIDISGTGYIDFWTTGYLELGAEFSASFWGNNLAVTGAVNGSVFNANNVQATNPATGQRLRGTHAQLSGRVSGTVAGIQVGSIELLMNTIGWSGCARLGNGRLSLELGARGYWSGGFGLGCDMGQVRLIVPGTINGAGFFVADIDSPFVSSGLTGVTPSADTSFDVAGGEEVLGILMRSAAGTPNTLVISPTGQVYDVSADFGDDGPVTNSEGNEQVFIIEDPAAGTWTVSQVPGSPVLEAVETYLKLPDVDVTADFEQDGDRLSFDYSVVEVDGQSVSFVERTADGVVVNLVGRVESEGAEGTAGLLTTNNPGSTVQLRTIESSGTTTGSIAYRSNASLEGGDHELVALVDQDGLPRAEVVLATYEVAPASQASAPIAVTATASSDGATVTWQPPTDDGGRQIVAYHVSSERGFTLAVDGEARSAEFSIPQMTPGETLQVFVQAFTAAGPGESGVGTFEATAATGPMYEQAVQPLSFVLGSEPMSPPSNTPAVGPDTVATPVDPDPSTVPSTVPPIATPEAPTPPQPAPVEQLPASGASTWAPAQLALLLLIVGLTLRFGVRGRRHGHV